METFKQNVATDRESGETWKERQHNNTDSGIQNGITETETEMEYRIKY